MNLKKFISENIVDIGSHDKESTTQKPIAHEPAKTQPAQKSFINRQNDASVLETTSLATGQNTGVTSSEALSDARARIAKVLADSNLPGTDYYEFVITKNAMSSIPVENERYTVAYAGLSAMGLTKETLNTSAEYYIKTIDNELSTFLDQFGKVYKTEVLDKKDAIAAKQKQMVHLSEQINKLNDEIKKINDEVQHDEATLIVKKNSFQQAAAEAQQTIHGELEKINQYIH
jgi:cell division protein FtsB